MNVSACGGAERREAPFQFHPDCEQEGVALEIREAEVFAQALQCRRSFGVAEDFGWRLGLGRRVLFRRLGGLARRCALKRSPHPRQRRQQVAAVGFRPGPDFFPQPCHMISICGLSKRPSAPAPSGLSAPSTWTRTR